MSLTRAARFPQAGRSGASGSSPHLRLLWQANMSWYSVSSECSETKFYINPPLNSWSDSKQLTQPPQCRSDEALLGLVITPLVTPAHLFANQ